MFWVFCTTPHALKQLGNGFTAAGTGAY